MIQTTLPRLTHKEENIDQPLFKKAAFTQSLNSPNYHHPPVKIYILEPFERLKKACEDVHKHSVGDE